MSERYKRLFSLPEESYAEGAPVSIAAGALLLDTERGTVLTQLKYRSFSTKPIKALTVVISPMDVAGVELQQVRHRYLDLDVKRGEQFAQRMPVAMPDRETRAFTAAVTEAVFDDGIVWRADAAPWEALPEPVPFDEELLDQYRIECGEDCKFAYGEHKDLWFCACGEANKREDDVCVKCGKSAERLKAVDAAVLREHKEQRLEEERRLEEEKRLEEERRLAEEARIAEEKRMEAERIAEEKRTAKEIARKAFKKTVSTVFTTLAVCVVAVMSAVMLIIPKSIYNNAVKLYEAGEYDAAIGKFEKLNGYMGSAEQVDKIKYAKALALYEAKEYDAAIDAFEALDGYADSRNKLNDVKYARAIDLREAGYDKSALTAFIELAGYKDSSKQALELYTKQFAQAEKGDIVYFGAYEQNNNTNNGKEAIAWQVLDKQYGQVLLISKYALECKQYNTKKGDITWEERSLRQWLNNGFVDAAFSQSECGMIATTQVAADKNPDYSTDPGNTTADRVFLLSIREAEEYFDSNAARRVAPTAYAKEQGVNTSDKYNTASGEEACWWWLRTPGYYQYSAAEVKYDGTVSSAGGDVNNVHNAVRPAMWVSIE